MALHVASMKLWMAREMLGTVLALFLCVSAGNSCMRSIIKSDDFTVEVEISDRFAIARLLGKGPPVCPGLQYNVTVRDGTSSFNMCLHEIPPRSATTMEFSCSIPTLNANLSLMIAVVDNSPQQHYSLYTTDIQDLTAEADTTTAKITCHFATGTLCKGCVVKWWEITTEGKRKYSLPNGELNVSRANDLLTATETVRDLIPGRNYSLVGYEIGMRSEIGIITEFMTLEESADDSPTFTLVLATVVAFFLVFTCAVLVILLVKLKRRKSYKVSVKRISSIRAKARAQTESKELTIRKTEDNYLEVGPPLPPRTLDMFIPVPDDSTSTYSTNSTTVTIEDPSSTDSSSKFDSTPPTLRQQQTFSTTLDTISISSDSPPIPPRTPKSHQDDFSSHASLNTSSNPNPTSHEPQHPPCTCNSHNKRHVWQVSVHNAKPRRWFTFPGMLRVSRVNANCIPVQPNLSYETFTKNGSAMYK